MSHIDDLIQELCPDGVKYEALEKLVVRGEKMRWDAVDPADEFRYIDLGTVNRVTHAISDTEAITKENAPSRAQQIVREGDVLFGTTRPMLKRYCVVPTDYDGQVASTGFCVLRAKTDRILTNFLFHVLGTADFYEYVEANERGTSYPAIPDNVVKRFRIPVPPLEVQHEAVRVLDKFTQLEAELEAELEARRAQYTHYRQAMLDQVDAPQVALEDLGTWVGGMTPSKQNSAYWDGGEVPWVASMDVSAESSNQIRGRVTARALRETSLKIVPGPSIPVVMRSNILRRALPVGFVQGDSTVNQDIRALVVSDAVDARYAYQVLRADSERIRERCVRTDGSMAAVASKAFFAWQVPLPNIAEQRRIAAALDEFDALVNDISVGLPAELTARRKQYEYYRDCLLTFEELGT